MIALIFATSVGSALNFTEATADTVGAIAPARKLSLVPKVAPAADGKLTVAQFCAARGADLPLAVLSKIGRKASALSRAGGLVIGRAVEAFGEVNTYDANALAQAFAEVAP
jgi:hypothetical protein